MDDGNVCQTCFYFILFISDSKPKLASTDERLVATRQINRFKVAEQIFFQMCKQISVLTGQERNVLIVSSQTNVLKHYFHLVFVQFLWEKDKRHTI